MRIIGYENFGVFWYDEQKSKSNKENDNQSI